MSSKFLLDFSDASVDQAETRAVLNGGYVSSTDSVYTAGTRKDHYRPKSRHA